jgi:hypothetical protein
LCADVYQDAGKDHYAAEQDERIEGLSIKLRADHRDQGQAQKVDGGDKARRGK